MHCNKAFIILQSCRQDLPMDNEAEIFYQRGTALACVG